MHLKIISKSIEAKEKFRKSLLKEGIKESNNPNIIISLGGDGTFLRAERLYPGIPKFLYRDQSICKKCSNEDIRDMIKELKNHHYTIEPHQKLKAQFKNKSWLAVNDILIRNKRPNQAIRFSININKKKSYPHLIGDGIVISTPFGSTAYFKAITKWSFKKGLGLAFNNITSNHNSIVIQDKAIITFKLERGDAILAADNNSDMALLKEGAIVKIGFTNQYAKIIRVKKWPFEQP